MESDNGYVLCKDSFYNLLELEDEESEHECWLRMNIPNFVDNHYQPLMSVTEQVVVDIAMDKITSGHNKESENCNVETLLKMCFEARDLVIRCTPFLKTQRTYPGHVYMLICYHLGIQLYSDVEYRYLSYIDPKYIETRVRWSMAFQAIYGNH